MGPSFLRKLNNELHSGFAAGETLVNLGLSLRSCGCSILAMDLTGFTSQGWKVQESRVVNIVNEAKIPWDVAYLGFFPGTGMIRRVTFRSFCPHCEENYLLDGAVGMGSQIILNRTGSDENVKEHI